MKNILKRFREKVQTPFPNLNFALKSATLPLTFLQVHVLQFSRDRLQKDVILSKINLCTSDSVFCLLLSLGRSQALFYSSGSIIFNSVLDSQETTENNCHPKNSRSQTVV